MEDEQLAIAEVRRCWDAQEDLAEHLAAVLPGYVEALRRGRNAFEVDPSVPFPDQEVHRFIDEQRKAVAEAVDAFAEGRLQLRLALIRLSLAQGHSLSEVADSWKVSRQYVSKLVRNGRFGEPEDASHDVQ